MWAFGRLSDMFTLPRINAPSMRGSIACTYLRAAPIRLFYHENNKASQGVRLYPPGFGRGETGG